MFWDNLTTDVRRALRGLPRSPSFSVIVILTLALGIAANTVIFSLMHPYLFRPLPYEDADRLVQLGQIDDVNSWDSARFSLDQIADFEDRSATLEAIGGYHYTTRNLTGAGTPERVMTGVLTPNLFDVLGAPAELGRPFSISDTDGPVAVLGHGLWQRRFAGDAGIVGRSIDLDGVPHTVLGVMPPDFNFPFGSVRVWVPFDIASARARDREWNNFLPVARIAPGASREQVRDEMNRIHAALATVHPDIDGRFDGVSVKPLREALNFAWDILRVSFGVLLAAVVGVLLLACVNVASLMLARTSTRSQEVAVRAAVGASRGRLVQQLLTESAILAVLGGGLGVVLAPLALRAIGPIIPEDLYRVGSFEVDGTVLLFTVVVTLLTPLVFGLGPALAASRGDLNSMLRSGGRGSSAGKSAMRGRRMLVVTEVALAVVLIAAAGLMLRSLFALNQVDLGFDAGRLLAVEISLPENDYSTPAEVDTYYRRAGETVSALPGVLGTGNVSRIPLNHESVPVQYARPGEAPADPDSWPVAISSRAARGYFGALGAPLLSGRDFETGEQPGEAIVISESLSQRLWPSGDAIGARLQWGDPRAPRTSTVVGIVGDVRYDTVDGALRPHLYAPIADNHRRRFLVVRTDQPPAAATRSVRSALAGLDADLPLEIRPMGNIVRENTLQWSITSAFLAAFGVIALLLAALGIYGIIAFSVTRRRKEMGIRMALGANARSIARLVLGEGLSLTARGLAVGMVLALVVARLAASLLFGISPFDTATFGGVLLMFLLLAVVASVGPALRAARQDPQEVLNNE